MDIMIKKGINHVMMIQQRDNCLSTFIQHPCKEYTHPWGRWRGPELEGSFEGLKRGYCTCYLRQFRFDTQYKTEFSETRKNETLQVK